MKVYTNGKEEAHRERDAQDVVDAGPYEVSADDGEDGAGEMGVGATICPASSSKLLPLLLLTAVTVSDFGSVRT